MYGRHSNSIDVSTQRCGVCRGTLIALGKFTQLAGSSGSGDEKQTPARATPSKKRVDADGNAILTPFAKFVKEQYRITKAANPVCFSLKSYRLRMLSHSLYSL